MENIDLDYGAAVSGIAIETVARLYPKRRPHIRYGHSVFEGSKT